MLMVSGSAEAIYDDFADLKFRTAINNDGTVQWSPGGRYVTSCQLDITFYPFDQQHCELDFVDWTVGLCSVTPRCQSISQSRFLKWQK